MAIEEIIRGESKNIEFKEMLPKTSDKYIKTVIAYANTQGGKLVFGVTDSTREIVGIDTEIVFQTMDRIINAISDSCNPQIVPNVELKTIENKTIIVVTVSPEPHRPYYLKSKGKENGTYIRVGSTTRLASHEKIKELDMEGARISWDELVCVGYKVTDDAIEKLCSDMNAKRQKIYAGQYFSERVADVTASNLENWNVLKKTHEGYLASNAFVLLTSDYFQFSKTQCAVFKGTERVTFLDKREYSGPIYEQIEESIKFVLRNIRLGAKIDGLVRKEAYELPVEAIREMIVNAHCHRNMTAESCVQIAVFDDRVEVTSPGGFYNGLTFEEAMNGHSKLRNRVIANVFAQMGLVEAWGTGFRRIQKAAFEYNLPAPEFIEMPEVFRVNFYRYPEQVLKSEFGGIMSDDVGETSNNVGEKRLSVGEISNNVGEKQRGEAQIKCEILEIIGADNKVSALNIAKTMSLTSRTVERYIRELKNEGRLLRHGAARGGHWEIVE